MMQGEYTIKLTNSQVDNLIEFFDFDFIRSVRDDIDLTSMDYIVDMVEIYTKLKKVKGEESK